jgi:hypothetical protein
VWFDSTGCIINRGEFRNHNNTEFSGTTSTDNLFNGNQNEEFQSRSISRKGYIVNFEIVQRCLLLGRILLPCFFLLLCDVHAKNLNCSSSVEYLGCVFLYLLWYVKTRKTKTKRHCSHTPRDITTHNERNRKRRKKRSFVYV